MVDARRGRRHPGAASTAARARARGRAGGRGEEAEGPSANPPPPSLPVPLTTQPPPQAKKASGKGSKKKSSKAKSAPKKTAASSSSSGKKDKKVDPLKRKMDEFVTRYSQYTPEHKNASDVKALVMACDFNELAIERVIAQWWKGPNARVVMRYRCVAAASRCPAPQTPPPPQPRPSPPSKPKPIHPDDAQEIELERVKQKSAALKFDKELTDFASLMVKGIELKLCEGEEKRQVVFYMSVDAVTLYVASEKHAADAAAYPIDSMTSVAADSSDKALIIGTGSKKVRSCRCAVATLPPPPLTPPPPPLPRSPSSSSRSPATRCETI